MQRYQAVLSDPKRSMSIGSSYSGVDSSIRSSSRVVVMVVAVVVVMVVDNPKRLAAKNRPVSVVHIARDSEYKYININGDIS